MQKADVVAGCYWVAVAGAMRGGVSRDGEKVAESACVRKCFLRTGLSPIFLRASTAHGGRARVSPLFLPYGIVSGDLHEAGVAATSGNVELHEMASQTSCSNRSSRPPQACLL